MNCEECGENLYYLYLADLVISIGNGIHFCSDFCLEVWIDKANELENKQEKDYANE